MPIIEGDFKRRLSFLPWVFFICRIVKRTGGAEMMKRIISLLSGLMLLCLTGCGSDSVQPGVEPSPAATASEEVIIDEVPAEQGKVFSLKLSPGGKLSAGNEITVAVKDDGTVLYAGTMNAKVSGAGACVFWKNIVSVAAGQMFVVGIRDDGTACVTDYVPIDTSYFPSSYKPWNGAGLEAINDWTDIVEVDAGLSHAVGLKQDGSVVAAGNNSKGACDVENWDRIISVSAGASHTVGLRSDGTVVAIGSNEDGQCEVSDWENIVSVSAGTIDTVGLTLDGHVLYAGPELKKGDIGSQLASWEDIVAVSSGDHWVVGLKADGTVVSTAPIPLADLDYGQNQVEKWTDIVAIRTGTNHSVGLKSDGTVVAVGNKGNGCCDVKDWSGVYIELVG